MALLNSAIWHVCLTAAAKRDEIRRPQLKQLLDTHTCTNRAETRVALEMKMIICNFKRHRNKRGNGREAYSLKMHSFCYTGCANATELTPLTSPFTLLLTADRRAMQWALLTVSFWKKALFFPCAVAFVSLASMIPCLSIGWQFPQNIIVHVPSWDLSFE